MACNEANTETPESVSNRICRVLIDLKNKFYWSLTSPNILFFNVTYHTCVTPYFVKKSDGETKFSLSKLQQVLSGIVHFMAFAWAFRLTFHTLVENENWGKQTIFKNPILLVQVSYILTIVPYYMTIIYIFWRKRKFLENFWSSPQNTHQDKDTTSVSMIMVVNFSIVILLIAMSVIDMLTWPTWINDGIKEAIEKLYLQSHFQQEFSQLKNNTLLAEDIGAGAMSLGVFQRIIRIYFYHLRIVYILIVLISAIQVYNSCKGFSNFLNEEGNSISKVWENYLSIRNFTKRNNDFIGKSLPIFVIDLLLFCLDRPIYVLNEGYAQIAKVYCTIAIGVAIMVISADAHRNMGHLKEWLFQYKINKLLPGAENNPTDEERYETLMWDSETTKIGFGCQVFTLTYGFLALFISVWATYGAIQLQFYNSEAAAS